MIRPEPVLSGYPMIRPEPIPVLSGSPDRRGQFADLVLTSDR
ncbi:hypothetical protein [Nannocystis punicea]|uniref:Uncharacterized protein n=1 Tax=Nannocystis punicea TaxID=2995304 RepID=A0ABY7HJF0_9BACT|nr:hypothetical protein [Nannocystis poenicansa]WAS99461.1 hypothetical protein O0S08_25325 [Nannocystis poenicansa]